MSMESVAGKINIKGIAKICASIAIVLILIGFGIGFSKANEVRQERKNLEAINQSIVQQGLVDKTKSLMNDYVSKFRQTKNIIVTDKDSNILFSTNTEVIGTRTKFELVPGQNRNGVINLKDSPINFISNPKVGIPFIQKYQDNRNMRYGKNNDNGPMMGNRMMNGNRENEFRPDGFMFPNKPSLKAGFDQNTLLLNSYKDSERGLFIYYICQGMMQDNLMGVLFTIGLLLKLLGLIFWLLIAVWVYRDSKRRGLEAILWGIFVIFTGIFGLLVYLVYKHYIKFCNNCGFKVSKDINFCNKCGNKVLNKCPGCEKVIDIDQAYCTNCGTKNEVEKEEIVEAQEHEEIKEDKE